MAAQVNHDCPHCGHPMPEDDFPGVVLPRIKKRIYQEVSKASPHGISLNLLVERVYWDDPEGGPLDPKTMHVHVNQLNNKWLRPRGLEIRSPVGRNDSSYTLRRL